ncbi:MAG: NUDIX hydrolase [Gammaproteobacteria bacterium]|nr:NUDIX hydrolase [Gammaproteobacteria bacterium]
MSFRPDVTVAAVVERDGRFLVVQERAARRVVFNQPAGHLEEGETLLQAVIRETLEETGHGFEPEALTGLYLWRSPTNRTFLRVAFSGRVGERVNGTRLDRAIIRTVWLTRAELGHREPELRSPLVLRCIDDYLRGVRYPLALLNDLELGPAAGGTASGSG